MSDCPFCEIVAGRAPAQFVADGFQSIAIVPLGPVTPGHFLVIPRTHVADAYEDPAVTSATMRDAADWARRMSDGDPRFESVNLITSVGRPATQSVFHLHIHVVPRRVDDGLALPWYSGKRSGRSGSV